MYPVEFEIDASHASNLHKLYTDIFEVLLADDAINPGDLVIFTKGDLHGVSGGTNAMKILEATRA